MHGNVIKSNKHEVVKLLEDKGFIESEKFKEIENTIVLSDPIGIIIFSENGYIELHEQGNGWIKGDIDRILDYIEDNW